MKKWIALLLTAAMLVSMTACTGGDSGDVLVDPPTNLQKEVSFTNYDFIKGSASNYQIVLPDAATENEQWAASEIQFFTEEATGIKLPIVTEAKAADVPSIYVGETKAAAAAGVIPAYEQVKNNGFVMKTVGDDCYLCGYRDLGTRNAAYEFLDYCFAYEYYARGEYYVKATTDLKLPLLDETVLPDFDWRKPPAGEVVFHTDNAYRLRLNLTWEEQVLGTNNHNSFTILDPAVYYKTHPDWYSSVMDANGLPAQLCYSNADMYNEFIKNLIDVIKDTQVPVMLLGMQDNVLWCECEKCTASEEKYGTHAAEVIKFLNKAQTDVNAWFKANRPNIEPVKLIAFAYYETVEPPVTYDEVTDTYKPIDESMVVHEDAGIMYAPILASYAVPFTDPVNTSVLRQLRGWAALTDNIYAWVYQLLTRNGLVFMDSVDIKVQNYRLLLENNVVSVMDQGSSYQENANAGWERLKTYLSAKLMWDSELNMQALIDDWFDHYFDEAADTMQGLFEEQRVWMRHLYNDLGASGSIGEDLAKSTYWTVPQLEGYLKQIDQAYADILPLKETDPERYTQLYDRITLESLQFRYLMICVYPSEFTKAELLAAKQAFRMDFERLGLISHAENTEVSNLWNSWGIA